MRAFGDRREDEDVPLSVGGRTFLGTHQAGRTHRGDIVVIVGKGKWAHEARRTAELVVTKLVVNKLVVNRLVANTLLVAKLVVTFSFPALLFQLYYRRCFASRGQSSSLSVSLVHSRVES